MSEHTIFLSPSEAFLIGLSLGEWQEYHDHLARLNHVQRDVCGFLYRGLPKTFYQVLQLRFGAFVPETGYFEPFTELWGGMSLKLPWFAGQREGKLHDIDSQFRWVQMTDSLELGVTPDSPFAVFQRPHGVTTGSTRSILQCHGLRINHHQRKLLLDTLCYQLRDFAALPYDLAILIGVAASEELSSNWSAVCEIFSDEEEALQRFLRRTDSRAKIEATLGPALESYGAEVDAGRSAGCLLAALEIDRREHGQNEDDWTEQIQNGLSRWNEDPEQSTDNFQEELDRLVGAAVLDAIERQPGWANGGFVELSQLDNELRDVIRERYDVQSYTLEERPPIALHMNASTAIGPFLNKDIVRASTHATSLLEHLSTFSGFHDRDSRHDVATASWWLNARAERDEEGDWFWTPGGYFEVVFQESYDWEDSLRKVERQEYLALLAIGVLIGDMTDRDRAFLEEDARKILPRNQEKWAIDDVGQLRDYLPPARKLLALGPSARGGDEAFVVKSLATSLEPIMQSAFPDRFPVREGLIPETLSKIVRDTSTEHQRLASTLFYLWKNYRNVAAHGGSVERFSHAEARAVYSLYELAVELHDRIVESRDEN